MRTKMKNDSLVKKIIKIILRKFNIKVSNKVENLLVQIFKFGIVGFIATLIDFVFLYIFKDLVGFSLLISNTLSFTISVIYNYIASTIFVFNVDKNKNSKNIFIKFFIFSIIGLVISNVLLKIFVNVFDIYYLIAKVIATIVVMVFNFVTRKKFLE